ESRGRLRIEIPGSRFARPGMTASGQATVSNHDDPAARIFRRFNHLLTLPSADFEAIPCRSAPIV
ncbi:MAG TPA: hypothetical protein VE999_06775, partial [Gemmataceae bacterium]|nr:hypothetical protein [Gemmataceae bacterium]